MTKLTRRRIRQTLALGPVLLGLAATIPTASADTFYVSGIYSQGCFLYGLVGCGGGNTLTGIPHAPSFTLDQTFHGESFTPVDGVTTIATSHMSISANSSTIHASADTSITFGMIPPLHALGPVIELAEAQVENLDTHDTIRFISGTVAPGTSITYQLTEILDSTITGPCDTSPQGPGAYAAFVIDGLPVLDHTACGLGSDAMSASGIFTSTVGSSFELHSLFEMFAVAGFGNNIPAVSSFTLSRSVDALDTAGIYINVLTPGVNFAADSGLSYAVASAPEPGSVVLFGAGLLMLAARGQRRRR